MYTPQYMSKEMIIIGLGAWIIVIRIFLGVPGNWQTALLIATAVAIMVIGFLLRGEAIGRQTPARARMERNGAYPFVENTAPTTPTHEHKEGITSLN